MSISAPKSSADRASARARAGASQFIRLSLGAPRARVIDERGRSWALRPLIARGVDIPRPEPCLLVQLAPGAMRRWPEATEHVLAFYESRLDRLRYDAPRMTARFSDAVERAALRVYDCETNVIEHTRR